MPRGSGRRPKPTKLRKLGGKAGHRALNEKEPQPALGEPEMPAGFSSVAREEWRKVVPELLRLQVLSKIDGKALAAYCQSYARWRQAEAEIDRLGLIIDGKRNPAVAISNDALKLMKSFLIEFGMTPAARTRLKIEGGDPPEDPLDALLRKRIEASPTKYPN